MRDSLGFSSGLETFINTQNGSKEIYKWLAQGGISEDDPYPWLGKFNTRPANHFHDPLKSLDKAGFTGIWGSRVLSGKSALAWAQLPPEEQSPGGYYSWRDLRGYYYQALTATHPSIRDEYFAKTFQGLGQLMHLVQDMSVPEHVRDDGHYGLAKTLETWADKALDRQNHPEKHAILTAALNAPAFDIANLNKPSSFPEAYIPISLLFDTNLYTKTNPDPQETLRPDIGLAEYTNANFVSTGTLFRRLFTDKYPYPSKATSVTKVERNIPDPFNPGFTTTRKYWLKVADGETGPDPTNPGYLLAGVDYLPLYSANPELDLVTIPPLDDRVFADYAKLLLPRAVGYSATLLQYFFRGKLETNGTVLRNIAGDVTALRLNIRNVNEGEALHSGQFRVVGKYRPAPGQDFAYTISPELNSGSFPPAPDDCGKIFAFYFGQAIPANAVDVHYTLVFRGTLGHESGSVIASKISLDPIGFSEEWDNGLHGNHTWLHSDIDIVENNPANGDTVNLVSGGRLFKENIRYAGHKTWRGNQSIIGEASYNGSTGEYCMYDLCLPYDFGIAFPVPITSCTKVHIKVDDMAISPANNTQSCWGDNSLGYQGIILEFDNGIVLMFTMPGQRPQVFSGYHIYLTPGEEISFNIHQAFADAGVNFGPEVKLLNISIVQEIYQCVSAFPEEHRQRLEVDFIRIE